jgi:hypothetical protein
MALGSVDTQQRVANTPVLTVISPGLGVRHDCPGQGVTLPSRSLDRRERSEDFGSAIAPPW